MSKNTPTLKATWEKVGGLSKPSKMPGYGYSISAKKCHVGSRLRKIENSVCSTCYALKGRYVFDNVKKAHANRFRAMKRKEHMKKYARNYAVMDQMMANLDRQIEAGKVVESR